MRARWKHDRRPPMFLHPMTLRREVILDFQYASLDERAGSALGPGRALRPSPSPFELDRNSVKRWICAVCPPDSFPSKLDGRGVATIDRAGLFHSLDVHRSALSEEKDICYAA